MQLNFDILKGIRALVLVSICGFANFVKAADYDYDLLESLMSTQGLTLADLGNDPDADGLITHFELALGTDPDAWDPDQLTVGQTLIYPSIENPDLMGVTVDLWQSPGLVDWTPFAGTSNWADGLVTIEYNEDNFFVLLLNRVENRAPIVSQGPLEVLENTPRTLAVDCSDPDGDDLTYSVTSTVNTAASVTGNQLTLTPTIDYFGPASISMTVSDGKASVPFDISITVTEGNREPIVNQGPVAVLEDTPRTITVDCTDPDGDDLTYAVTAASNIGYSLIGDQLTLTPATGYSGPASVSMTVSDGEFTVAFDIEITVTNVNQSPVANQGPVVILEDTPTTITLNGSDPDGDELTYAVTGATNIGYSLTGDQLTLTPAAEYSGPASISMTVSDAEFTVPFDFSITVTAVNDAPEVNQDPVDILEDTPTTITLNGSDPDDNVLTYAVTGAVDIAASLTGDQLTLTPAADYSGPASVSMTVSDGENTVPFDISITVLPVNDEPVVNQGPVEIFEDSPTTITLDCSDPDGDDLTYAVIDTVDIAASVSGDQLTLTPGAEYSGQASVSMTVSDGIITVPFVINITVITVNDAPSYTGNYADMIVTLMLPIQGFSDVDSSLTYSLVNLPAGWSQSQTGEYITVTTDGSSDYSVTTAMSASDGNTAVLSDEFILTDTYVPGWSVNGNDFSVYFDVDSLDSKFLLRSADPLPLWGVVSLNNADITVNPFESTTDYLTKTFFDANLETLPDDASDPAGLFISAQTVDKDFYNIYWTVEDTAALSFGVIEVTLENQDDQSIAAYIPDMPIGPAP